MEVILSDGRKATVVSGNASFTIVRLEDGREVPYPNARIKPVEQEKEPEFNMVIIPAIERLEELRADMMALNLVGAKVSEDTKAKYDKLFTQLSKEAEADLIKKWGLTS